MNSWSRRHTVRGRQRALGHGSAPHQADASGRVRAGQLACIDRVAQKALAEAGDAFSGRMPRIYIPLEPRVPSQLGTRSRPHSTSRSV